MSNIRVTYSGLISFAIGFVSLFTGLIFTIIVVRQLSQEEFGTWSLLGGMISYVLIFGPIVSYWTTREIARNENSGSTAIITSGMFSVISIIIFILISIIVSDTVGIDKQVLILASILVPLELIRNVLLGISHGFKPQLGEYGLLVFELTKIPMALILVYYFHMGLEGVIFSVAIAYIPSIVLIGIKSREHLVGKFQIKYLKKWLKLSWLPIYPNLVNIITELDVLIFTTITGSVNGLAFWGSAKSISVIVGQSRRISKAVYPKLLAEGNKEIFQENLLRVFYFAFPLIIMSMVFSKPALFALNPLYQEAYLVVIIYSPVIFLRIIGNVFEQALSGIEKVDKEEKSTFKDYLKSNLFKLPTLRIIQRVGYIVSLIIILLLISEKNTELELVEFWAIIALITQIPHTIYLYILAKKSLQVKINPKILLKYIGTSIFVFVAVHYSMEKFLEYNESIFEFLPQLLFFVGIGLTGYLGITFLIDLKTRKLFLSIKNELINRGQKNE